MCGYSQSLRQLAAELLEPDQLAQLQECAYTAMLDHTSLLAIDDTLGGPSIRRLTVDGRGQYDIADREIFRPLQYCGSVFRKAARGEAIDWLTREVVHMSALHIEELVKRIARTPHQPLGAALHQALRKGLLDPTLGDQIKRFTGVYNAAKHAVDQPKDTHLFSVRDAVFAYVVGRQLAMHLYPLVALSTRLDRWTSRDSCPEEQG